MPKMIALREFPFGPPGQRQQLKKGDTFDAKQKIARLLVAAKMAKEAEASVPDAAREQAYATRHLEAAPAQRGRAPARASKPVAAMTSADLRGVIQKHHGNVRGLSRMSKSALVRLANKVLQ